MVPPGKPASNCRPFPQKVVSIKREPASRRRIWFAWGIKRCKCHSAGHFHIFLLQLFSFFFCFFCAAARSACTSSACPARTERSPAHRSLTRTHCRNTRTHAPAVGEGKVDRQEEGKVGERLCEPKRVGGGLTWRHQLCAFSDFSNG